jgi:hypothetical protein
MIEPKMQEFIITMRPAPRIQEPVIFNGDIPNYAKHKATCQRKKRLRKRKRKPKY